MLKGHPKGLYVAFFANMGERFGYYTMLAIFVLYLQAKYGFSATEAGAYYGGFLFGIYFLPLLGGIIADRMLGYGKTITLGTIVMFIGYLMLAIPGQAMIMTVSSLAVISLGTGFFKGNLQALVGNMYDDPRYNGNRDNAFNIFYMGINIGAFFAPSAATGISNWILGKEGLTYDPRIPDLAHKFIEGNTSVTAELAELAKNQLGATVHDLARFSHTYIDTLSASYNAGFGIAAVSMIVSFLIFIGFRKYYKSADITEHQKSKDENLKSQVIVLKPEETRARLIALFLVFSVVMFFWMAFHQNGFTMSIFARDYTESQVSNITYIFFDLAAFLPLLAAIIGLILIMNKKTKPKWKLAGALLLVAGSSICYWVFSGYEQKMNIAPQMFQHFNPIFIVFLTPVIIGFFTHLRENGKEPSSPRKIGIGMILTAVGFMLLVGASVNLMSPKELQGGVSDVLRSPYWLISTYFMLTIAELFLSPIGISFVSKVAPPKYKGLAQGGWLAATAIGNLMAGLIGYFWDKIELWQFFTILVVMCLLSTIFIFSIIKRLEKATD
ncbi:Di-tripeptide/cation symporter [hydrothermal vent metagenome]|uniref:Di-tripeptide/cation symporter n=1 Tax=hydrothermal vent metagenome TaxID=652676 RepID=A0A3B0U2H3_9ZZZZ